jgi:hypothetical protein
VMVGADGIEPPTACLLHFTAAFLPCGVAAAYRSDMAGHSRRPISPSTAPS